MQRSTLRLILLISCAHALVHVFELALPSVEQMIGAEFQVDRALTGQLGTVWRLPFGLGAFLAGWMADRYGSRAMLVVYLLGCSATAWLAAAALSMNGVFVTMCAMGCFASIYHPAGLALISRETTAETRGRALGLHGIFGSFGIAGAPLVAGLVFQSGQVTWRQYYVLLTLPAVALAGLFLWLMRTKKTGNNSAGLASAGQVAPISEAAPSGQRRLYTTLLISGVLSGFVYAAFLHFLPRYLDGVGGLPGLTPESSRNALASIVLLCGVVGQWVAGRLALPGRLEGLLFRILLASVPFLVLMSVADGPLRFGAACGLALFHFMNQPVYNSLVAQYTATAQRSRGYGLSNMLCFGIGALGPTYAGLMPGEFTTYMGLAFVALLAALNAYRLKV